MSTKLQDKWVGPYYIHDKQSNGTYKLRAIEGQKIKNFINGNRLKLYTERRKIPEIFIENSNQSYMIKIQKRKNEYHIKRIQNIKEELKYVIKIKTIIILKSY